MQGVCARRPAGWRLTEWSPGEASDMDGQPIRARERERTSHTRFTLDGPPNNVSMSSNRYNAVWRSARNECSRRVVRRKDQKDFCHPNAGADAQAQETPSKETNAQSVGDSFSKAQEDFTDTVSNRHTEDKVKAQKSVSHANRDSRRKPDPEPNGNSKSFTFAASRCRKKRRTECDSFA